MKYTVVALQAVVPPMLIILLGCGARWRQWIAQQDILHFNRVSFSIFAPALCFYNLYRSDFSVDFAPRLLLFCALGVFVCWLLSVWATGVLRIEPEKRGLLILAFYLSNLILMGTPIVQSVYGEAYLGKTALAIGAVVPVNNILAVVSMEVFRGNRVSPREVLHGVATNPLIWACALGCLLNVSGIQLPGVVEKAVANVAGASSVLMLFLLGGCFRPDILSAERREILVSLVMRLVLIPALVLPAAVLLGFRHIDLLLILITFASPSGVLIFSLSNRLGGDVRLASGIIICSTLLSCVTMGLWLIVLMCFGLL